MRIRKIKKSNENIEPQKNDNKKHLADKKKRKGAKNIRFRKLNKTQKMKKAAVKIKIPRTLKTVIIVFLLILYIPTVFVWLFGKGVKTDLLKIGTLEETIETDGVFVRNESLLTSSVKGKCVSLSVLGEKVAKDQQIGQIVDNNSEKFLKEIKDIDNKMLQIVKEESSGGNFHSEDIIKIDNQIGTKLRTLSVMAMKNSVEGSEKVYSEVNELMKKKIELITSSDYTENSQLKLLKKQKDDLLKKSEENTKVLKTDVAGIISFLVDGYEKKLTPENVEYLSFEEFEKVKNVTNGRVDFSCFNVNEKEAYAKIICDFENYIVCFLDPRQVKTLKVGDETDINVVSINKEINTNVESIKKESGKYKVVFKTNDKLSEMCTIRKSQLEIFSNVQEGFKVPLKSLKDLDVDKKKAKIALNKANSASVRDVKIIAMDNEHAIIGNNAAMSGSGVALYDEYLVNPNNIKEGQMIDNGS